VAPPDPPPPRDEAPSRPPEWAGFLTLAGFAYFIHAVSRDIGARGMVARIDDRLGVMRVDGRSALFGLINLAQTCRHAPLDEWDGMIREHFDDLPLDEPAYGAHPPLDQVREHLRVRLYPAEVGGIDDAVQRPVAEGIVEVLVIDEPQRVRSVSRHDARTWDLSVDDLFLLARRLVRDREAVDVDVETIDGSTPVTLLHGSSFFVATHALWPDSHCTYGARRGVILAIPNRHAVFLHEVRDVGVVGAINAMGRSIPAMFRAGPGSISPLVYWWHDDEFTVIPMQVGRDRVLSVSPPPRLLEMLHELPETAGD
jgi:hypothetical protein